MEVEHDAQDPAGHRDGRRRHRVRHRAGDEACRADPAKAIPIAERPAKQDALAAGRAAFHSGDLARAEELLRSAAQAAPGDVAPLLALADVHVAQRRFPDAVADLDRAAVLGENAAVLAARGRALGLVRRFDDASRDLERAAEAEASRSETWATLAAVQVNRGDQVEADRAFAALVQLGDPAAAQDWAWTQLLAMLPDQVAPQETLDSVLARGRGGAGRRVD